MNTNFTIGTATKQWCPLFRYTMFTVRIVTPQGGYADLSKIDWDGGTTKAYLLSVGPTTSPAFSGSNTRTGDFEFACYDALLMTSAHRQLLAELGFDTSNWPWHPYFPDWMEGWFAKVPESHWSNLPDFDPREAQS